MRKNDEELKKVLLKKKMSIFLFSVAVFIVFSILYILIATIIQVNLDRLNKQEIIIGEERLVDVEKSIISSRIERLSSDLLYIADTLKLYQDGKGEYHQLEEQWISFSNRKAIYDQIRFIDLNGDEIIRVNYEEKGAYLTIEKELQNKKGRYYFTDSINLKKDQIYISKLDLNIENGQIENPTKPMIRLCTPVFNSQEELMGIIVLNYLAEDMLSQVRKIASSSEGVLFLNNKDGYWLYNGADSNMEWAFMYEDRIDETFPALFSEEWEEIKKEEMGYMITPKGVFSYATVIKGDDLFVDDINQSVIFSEAEWYVTSYIASDSKNGELFSKSKFTIIGYVIKNNIIVLIVLAMFAILFVMLVMVNKIEQNQIKYYSEFDTMTGAYNRRAGFEKLNRIYKEANKKSSKISLCFIDINGLKEVNDSLGHEMGDELILSIIKIIKNNMRTTDFIARFGGDEFLIIFYGMDVTEAEKVWERIASEFDRINTTENRKYLISVSHGIEEFKFNASEYIDLIINAADEKMYQEKRVIKKELKVIRS